MRLGPSFVAAPIVALALGACPEPTPLPEGSFPLVELADSAVPIVETDAVDIGDPESRAALWAGWGPDEAYPAGSFVWGAGERSSLRLDVVEPRDRLLRLRGWSFPFGDAPAQEVRVAIGSREIGRRKIGPQPTTLELELPREALFVGENFLELTYARHAGGKEPWAVGWDGVRLGDARPGGTPRIERGAGRIVIPVRTAMQWTLELAGGSWLSWRNLNASGDARLAISIESEEARSEHEPEPNTRTLALTREGAPHRLHSIVLRALGTNGELRLQGVRIHAPDLADTGAPRGRPPETAEEERFQAPTASPPNLLLYIVDTLRADHLGCYGYRRPTSPEIDAFARNRAIRYREARAQSSWTRPAVATLLTGLHPITHGAQQSEDRLPERIVTLAERLSAAGWQSAMVTTNGNVGGKFGISQGFDEYDYLAEKRRRAETHVRSSEAHRRALDWIDRRDPAKPFFLVIHSTDPHDPYTPAPEFRRKFAPAVKDSRLGTRQTMAKVATMSGTEAERMRQAIVALYDAEIAENDASFGALLGELARRALDASTALLFVSDHGEEFFEHGGWTHGQTLYEEQLRIPMLLALPDRRGAGSVVTSPVDQLDVVPTLLALAGLPPAPELPGRNLLRLEADGEAHRASFAWLDYRGARLASVARSEWKLIENRARRNSVNLPPAELFALASDPEERVDLSLRRPLRRHWLEGQLSRGRTLFDSHQEREQAEIDPELRATLEALGYL